MLLVGLINFDNFDGVIGLRYDSQSCESMTVSFQLALMATAVTIRYDAVNYGGRADVGEPMGPQPPGAPLASRLRELRRSGFPGVRLTQLQLATALSDVEPVADSTLSAWENVRSPTLPPHSRLSAYAQFFATERSLRGAPSTRSAWNITCDVTTGSHQGEKGIKQTSHAENQRLHIVI